MNKMNKQDIMKAQTCILRVSIHCDGCKHKVKKILQKVEGVYAVKIDADSGKVTVTGNADPATLLKKLEKSGKHAELWSQKGNNNNNNNNPFNMMNNQFMNLELGDFKGAKDSKSQSKGGGKKDQKGGHMMQHLMKGPPKNQKTVKFDLPEEEFDDFEDSDEDDDDFDYDSEDDELEFGHHPNHPPPSSKSKTKNLKDGGKGGGGSHGFSGMMNMLKGGAGNNSKKNGAKAKKGDEVEIPMQMKGLTGGSHNDGKGGKSGNGGKNNKGEEKWSHKGGGQPMMNHTQKEGGGGRGPMGMGMGQMSQMGQMGPMGPMGNYPMGAVQGLPAPGPMRGGGYYPGMGGGGGNPYNPHNPHNQQQYMAQMMMNQYQQQRPNGYDMYGGGGPRPMMFAPHPQAHPHPAMGYGPPMHAPVQDNFTHMFSDENTGSCSVM